MARPAIASSAAAVCLAILCTVVAAQFPDGAVTLSNGVIQVELNGVAPPGYRYPCITQLWVDGQLIVPAIAVGALFQMDVRSPAGDDYNPTQSGACAGNPSILKAWEMNWAFLPGGTANYGVLMGVVPRTFESSTGACTSGQSSPYYFNWGIQLGDDALFPKEAMLVEQTFQKLLSTAPNIISIGVEVPTVYYSCSFAQYAFYFPTPDVTQWAPLNHPSTGSNYVPDWPSGNGFMVQGFGNARCNGNDATTSVCGATYHPAHNSTAGGVNNGAGGCPANLVPADSYLITDMGTYGRLVIFAVGNQGTISTALSQTAALISASDWGNI